MFSCESHRAHGWRSRKNLRKNNWSFRFVCTQNANQNQCGVMSNMCHIDQKLHKPHSLCEKCTQYCGNLDYYLLHWLAMIVPGKRLMLAYSIRLCFIFFSFLRYSEWARRNFISLWPNQKHSLFVIRTLWLINSTIRIGLWFTYIDSHIYISWASNLKFECTRNNKKPATNRLICILHTFLSPVIL